MSSRDPSWCRDLCAEARAGRLDPVVGREELILCALRILSRRTKRNLLLSGPPGVGKTALAEGIAQVLARQAVPASLRGATVLSLDLGSMLSGTSYRGDFEGRVSALLRRLRDGGRPVVLFVDEIHLLLRAGRSEGGLDAANLLKPALARGEIICMGASTGAEWGRITEEDPALARRFTVLEVGEPDREQTLRILEALRPGLEVHHQVSISDEALAAAVDMPMDARCPTRLPDRAIDRLDEACAGLQLEAAGQGLGDASEECRVQVLPDRTGPRGPGRFDLRARAREIGVRRPRASAAAESEFRGGGPGEAAVAAAPRLLACHLILDTSGAVRGRPGACALSMPGRPPP